MERKAEINRKTKETTISVTLNLDGKAKHPLKQASAFLTICWKALPGMVCLI